MFLLLLLLLLPVLVRTLFKPSGRGDVRAWGREGMMRVPLTAPFLFKNLIGLKGTGGRPKI